ncbi:MAG: methyltransferase domain-containing protein [bacterium]
MIFLNLILISILLLILLLVILLSILFLLTPLFSKIPFVPVRKKVLNDIISALELSDKSVLYDLGCGDGRILFRAHKLNPKVRCVGIEIAPFPFFWAKARKFFNYSENVSIIHGDMFKTDISSATHIFLYLFPKIVDSLLPKFEKELRPGVRVVSCDFQFSNKKPIKTLNLKSNLHQINRRLFIYEF